jgi:hypothetical protein
MALDPSGQDDPAPSRTLALQFIWEPWLFFQSGLANHVTGGSFTPEQAEEVGRTAPIARELEGRNFCDGDWMRANVSRFVRAVEIRDRGWICLDSCGGEENGFGTLATCVITATEPEWLEHLRPGMEWKTTAYDRDEKD